MKRATKRKRKPLSKAQLFTSQELDMLAMVTPSDIESGKAHSSKYGSAVFNGMIQAERAEDEEEV